MWSQAIRTCVQGETVAPAKLSKQVIRLARTHFLFLLRRVYKEARVMRVGRLPHLRGRVTLAGGLTFSLVNTPGKVKPPTRINFLIDSRSFR